MSAASARRNPCVRSSAGRLAVLAAVLILVLSAGSPGSARPSPSALTLSLRAPQRADVTIARVDLPPPVRRRGQHAPHPAPLRVSLVTGSGFEYAALLALPARGRARSLLVVAANRRPASSLAPDPARIPLVLAGAGGVRPTVWQVVNPISTRQRGSVPAAAPTLCGLGAPTLAAARALLVVGSSFGYVPQAAAGRGLDAACGRTLDPAFVAALDAGQSCQPAPCATPAPCPATACCPPCGPVPRASAAAIACPLGSRPAYACPAAAGGGGIRSRAAG